MAISFVARSQNNNNASGVSLTVNYPSGIQAGDLVLAWIVNFGVTCPTPSGWSAVATEQVNSIGDHLSLFSQTYSSGSSQTFGSTLGFPKGVMRAYRGCRTFDATNGGAHTSAGATSLQIAALSNTVIDNEWYVALWTDDAATTNITGPGDLGNTTNDGTQWGTFEGDKALGAKGTTPGGETATGPSGNWVAFATTLIPDVQGYEYNVVTPPRMAGMQQWTAPVVMMRQTIPPFRAANLPDPYQHPPKPVPAWQAGMKPWWAPVPELKQWNVVFRAANLPDPYTWARAPIPAWQTGMQQWWAPVFALHPTITELRPRDVLDVQISQLPLQAIGQAWWAPVPALHPTITEFHGATDRDFHPTGFPFQAIGQPWWAPTWALHPTITELHGATDRDWHPTGFPLPAIQNGWQLQYTRIPPYGPNDIGIVAFPISTPTKMPIAAIQQGWWAPVQLLAPRGEQFGGINPGPAQNLSILTLMLPTPTVGGDPIVVWRHRAGYQ